MNILPKKRWHVRTKENIARVRKDEAEAAEKERQEQLRIETADREARLNLLKQKSKDRLQNDQYANVELAETNTEKLQHINFFDDLGHCSNTSNKEHDKEVKNKKEEYEKQIGYLTYLGQDTNESLGKKNWYEVAPSALVEYARPEHIKETYNKLVLKDADGKPRKIEQDIKNEEVCWKAKQKLDPINNFKKKTASYITNPITAYDIKQIKKKKKNDINQIDKKNYKDKHHFKKEKEEKLQKLRQARLRREHAEREKTTQFLTGMGNFTSKPVEKELNNIKQKYNSQFNPELARQNY